MTVPMMSVVVVVALPIDNKVLNLYFKKKTFYLLYLIYCLGYSTPIVASFAWASSSINYLDLLNGCDSNYHLFLCSYLVYLGMPYIFNRPINSRMSGP